MTTDIGPAANKDKQVKVNVQGGSGSPVYGIGLIGAWVYYIGRATTNRERVAGFFKGIVWPGFRVYEALAYLHRDDAEAGSPPPQV